MCTRCACIVVRVETWSRRISHVVVCERQRRERSVSPAWHRAALIRRRMPADTPVQHGSRKVHALSETPLPPAHLPLQPPQLAERRSSFVNPSCAGSASSPSTFFCHSAFLWLSKYSSPLSSSTSPRILPSLSPAANIQGPKACGVSAWPCACCGTQTSS